MDTPPPSDPRDHEAGHQHESPRRRVKVHRSHSENIARTRQRVIHHRNVQQMYLQSLHQTRDIYNTPSRDSGIGERDSPSASEDTVHNNEVGARDSGISLSGTGVSSDQQPPRTYRDVFSPWEKFVTKNQCSPPQNDPESGHHVVSGKPPPLPPTDSKYYNQSKERLGGLLTIDRRGSGRYWWNGYGKPVDSPSTRGRSLSRAHSFNIGQTIIPIDTSIPPTPDSLPPPPNICHMRVTSDPEALDPNLSLHRSIPITVTHTSHRGEPLYTGSPPGITYSPPYRDYSPSQGPTGGRYPSHTPPSTDTDHSLEHLGMKRDGSPHSSRHPLLRVPSKSTDELSRCVDEDQPAPERMTQSFTCGENYQHPNDQNLDNAEARHGNSWQPMVWLSEKGRKLSGFLERGRSRQSQEAERAPHSKHRKPKPRSVSVERGMKLSCVQGDEEAVRLRSSEQSPSRNYSKRWCYVYQDNDGIKLGSLSKDPKKKEEEENNKADAPPPAEEYNQPKQVIVQRDERGYGLTVSGDNPVFVQSVKENGAAARAGVHKGDRILKVNGTLVTKCNHKEVVKLIKSGSYVALTLLGRPSSQHITPPTPTPQPVPTHHNLGTTQPPVTMETSPVNLLAPPAGLVDSQRTPISGPTAVDPQMDKELKMQKISMIRFMYEQACEECEKYTEELRQNRDPSAAAQLSQKLDEKCRLRGRLGDQLYQLTGIPAESHITSPKSPPSGLPPPGGTFNSSGGHARSPLKRYGSGEALEYISEDKENASLEEESSVLNNPAPWLPSGPKHRKADSMPESIFTADATWSAKEITVTRSNSDSRRRPQNEDRSDIKDGALSADAIEKLRTSSLPTSVYDTDPPTEGSANQVAGRSSSPHRESWEDGDVSFSPTELESPNTTHGSGTSMSPPRELRPMQPISPLQADVIPMEDEEEVNMDDEHLEDHGPFRDLNSLKHKPAHLAVFLHYLISNSDPSPLLFYLVTEQYTQGTMKEMRRWAYEIFSTFLVPSAAIKVEDVETSLLENIEHTLLNRSDKEDAMRTVFQNVRHMAQKQISELLADFRQKRTLGLANLYGDNELSDNMDRGAEMRTVDSKLLPHLEKCSKDPDKASPRDKAMASALATIMKQLGSPSIKNSASLERCPTFISKDKKLFKIGGRSFKKNGHQFNPTHYHATTNCNYCKTVLWGIGYQGFQCANCELNAHKSCMEQMHDHCTGRKKKEKRSSMLSMIRKTTNPNPAAIKEAQRMHDDGHVVGHVGAPMTSPGPMVPASAPGNSLFHIRSSARDEEEDDLVREAQRLHEEKLVSQRALSMPSIRDAIHSTAPWRGSQTTLTPNYPYLTPIPMEDSIEQLRTGNKVSSLVEQYNSQTPPPDGSMTPPRGRSPDAMEMEEQKNNTSTNLGRSESLNKKRESRRSVRRTRSDVQVDDQTLKSLNQSGSSSNSSLSNRSLDSPSASAETLSEGHQGVPPVLTVLEEDSDFETEAELPPLDASIPKDVLKKLKPKEEKKRQDVINELFYTERNHVRNLKVMDKVFRSPLRDIFNDNDMIQTLFPGLEGLVSVHSKLNNRFKNAKKESCVVGNVADLLLSSFEGEAGEEFKKSCAIFCRDQTLALDYLRTRQRKDQKLANVLQEAASNPLCRRLELKDIIPTAMQRLTKYPLLIDNLMKYTNKNSEEYSLLQKANKCSKDILHYVNQAVKDRENQHKLEDFQRRLDRRSMDNPTYQNFDLRKYRLIHDGPLTWKIGKQKLIQLQVLLLDQYIVLLQKQDERLILKYQSTGKDDNTKNTHSPIISLSKLMVRPVATDKYAMFLISDGEVGPQIYELVGSSTDAIRRWFKNLAEGTSDYRQKKGKGDDVLSSLPPRPVSMVVTTPPSGDSLHSKHKETSAQDNSMYGKAKSHSLDGLEKIDHVEVHSVSHSGLTQPSEVSTSTVQVNIAHSPPTPSPQQRLHLKQQHVTQALNDKRAIIAEMLGVPVNDFNNIAEMASEIEGEKEPRELILGSLHQAQQLTCLVNSSLSLEGATVQSSSSVPRPHETNSASSGDVTNNNSDEHSHNDNSPVSSHDTSASEAGPSVANQSTGSEVSSSQTSDILLQVRSRELLTITAKLNSQLHKLMEVLSTREKEQEKLQAELRSAQAEINRLLDNQQTRSHSNSFSHASRPNSYVSVTSSTSEAGEASEDPEVAPLAADIAAAGDHKAQNPESDSKSPDSSPDESKYSLPSDKLPTEDSHKHGESCTSEDTTSEKVGSQGDEGKESDQPDPSGDSASDHDSKEDDHVTVSDIAGDVALAVVEEVVAVTEETSDLCSPAVSVSVIQDECTAEPSTAPHHDSLHSSSSSSSRDSSDDEAEDETFEDAEDNDNETSTDHAGDETENVTAPEEAGTSEEKSSNCADEENLVESIKDEEDESEPNQQEGVAI